LYDDLYGDMMMMMMMMMLVVVMGVVVVVMKVSYIFNGQNLDSMFFIYLSIYRHLV
jgi:hypothetical protein